MKVSNVCDIWHFSVVAEAIVPPPVPRVEQAIKKEELFETRVGGIFDSDDEV